MSQSKFSAKRIKELLTLLNKQLLKRNVHGQLYLVGGAVMCLAFNARASTKDIDGLFAPTSAIREAALSVATQEQIDPGWLNDSVKGFLSISGTYDNYLDLSNLKILVATPEYLLSMKCRSMRLAIEFHDEQDIRYLLRYLNIDTYNDAIKIITKFYPLEQFPQKTLYALEELLSMNSGY